MLTDTISKVEKLNATQQLTAMIIPSSTVNMSKDEDCCFQCQEPGHNAQHCPHIGYYVCDEYGHIIMDCPHGIPPLGTPATHHKSHKGHHARSNLRHHWEDRDRQNQSRSQSHFRRHCSSSHHDSCRGHSRSQHRERNSHHRSSSWWSCSTHWWHSHRPHHNTLHRSHHRSSQHQSSPGYQSWEHSRSHSWPSYRSSRHESHQPDSYSSRMRRRPHPKKNMEVKTEDPHTDYYSSDNHSSN